MFKYILYENFTAELYIQIAVNRQLCVGNSNLICINSNFSYFPWKLLYLGEPPVTQIINLGIILDFHFFLIPTVPLITEFCQKSYLNVPWTILSSPCLLLLS